MWRRRVCRNRPRWPTTASARSRTAATRRGAAITTTSSTITPAVRPMRVTGTDCVDIITARRPSATGRSRHRCPESGYGALHAGASTTSLRAPPHRWSSTSSATPPDQAAQRTRPGLTSEIPFVVQHRRTAGPAFLVGEPCALVQRARRVVARARVELDTGRSALACELHCRVEQGATGSRAAVFAADPEFLQAGVRPGRVERRVKTELRESNRLVAREEHVDRARFQLLASEGSDLLGARLGFAELDVELVQQQAEERSVRRLADSNRFGITVGHACLLILPVST